MADGVGGEVKAGRISLEVQGFAAFRKDLRQLDDNWSKELRKVHKALADHAASAAKRKATALGGVRAKAAPAIKSRATTARAYVGAAKSPKYPMALAAFWGMDRATGWNKGNGGGRQHPAWVGNSWDAGAAGQGPYVINDAVAEEAPNLIKKYQDMLDALSSKAFPD